MSFLLFMGTSCFSSFIPVLTQELGGGSGEVGTVFALTALSEVPAMFLMASILRKVPAKKVIVLAGLFYLLRLSLTAVAPNYIVMLLVQMFQGLSFAVIWPASMAYLNQIMDYEVRSTAIMTFSLGDTGNQRHLWQRDRHSGLGCGQCSDGLCLCIRFRRYRVGTGTVWTGPQDLEIM